MQHRLPRVEQRGLPLDFGFERFLDEAERVEVLELRACSELRRALRAQRQIGVATELALLEVGVRDIDVTEDAAQRPKVVSGLGRRAKFGLGHDLEQRNSSAVQVHLGPVTGDGGIVYRLASVLLHVDAGQTDAPPLGDLALSGKQFDPAPGRQRLFELRDLIALGQIGIEVVLAREDRALVHAAMRREPGADGQLHGVTVQHRQHPGKPQTDRVHTVIGLAIVDDGSRTEELRGRPQLTMHLEPDHDLVAVRIPGAVARRPRFGRPPGHTGSGGRWP